MAPKTGTVGGGPATGLAKDFTGWLDKALNTGSFGGAGTGDPTSDTRGFTGVLNDILSQGGGQFGGALGDLIKQRQTADIGDLRARFGAQGGMAFGTPAAYAESSYRAQAAPQAGVAIGQLQLQALQPILQALMGLSGMGIPQAQSYVSPSPWLSGVEALGGLATGVGDLAKAFPPKPKGG